MPRRVVTPENLSPDFLIDLEKEAGPVGLNLSPDHFERDVLTGVISVKGYVDPGDTVSGGTAIADEGVLVVEAPSAINFTGTGVTATDVEGVATVAIPGTAVSDEGVVVAAAPTGINFTGQGVTVAANIDGSVTVDVTGVEGGHTVTDEGVHVLMSTDLIPVPLPPLNMDFVGFTLVDNLDQTITISYEKIGTGPIVMARRPIIQRIVSTGVTAVTEGFAVHMDSAVDLSVTVPANAAELIPIGAEYEIVRLGTGAVTVQGAAGVTINGVVAGANEITIQYGSAVLRKIAADVWLLMGAIESAEPIPEVELPVYLWADVFTDHSATLVYSDNDPGADWTGWGESSASPAEVPLEWFMQNVLANEAPNGAIIDLTSPTGQIHLQGRMQPPSSRAARNFTLDLSGNRIERAQGDDYWGQFFIWGEKVTDSALDSEGIIGADAALGTKVLTLRYPHIATDPLLTAAAPGSIIEIRTNTTRKGYHPDESRTTCFVESVNFAAKTITVVDPLEIAVPENNPVGSWETSDPRPSCCCEARC